MESNIATKLMTPSLCRCCLADDCYKDISTEYFWMGKREVYAEMLLETFNINISQTKLEDLCNDSRLICEQCITQLRGASAFKQQVIHCDKAFQDHLKIQKSETQSSFSDPLEDLKRENNESRNGKNDFEILPDENEDNYDDVDDEPLVNLTSSSLRNKLNVKSEPTSNLSQKRQHSSVLVPPPIKRIKIPDKMKEIKNSKRIVVKPAPVKIQSRLLTSGTLDKRYMNQQLVSKLNKVALLQAGSNRSMGRSISRLVVKEPKVTGKGPMKMSNVGGKIIIKKPTGQPLIKPSTSTTKPLMNPKKDRETSATQENLRLNAKLLIKYSTAYPFKLPEDNITCVYCGETINIPSKYRDHMEIKHPEVNLRGKSAFLYVQSGFVKVDISVLHCRICYEAFDSLDSVAQHLREVHDRPLDLNSDLGLQPFKFIGDSLKCTICAEKFHTLRSLSRHTQSHFSKFPCEICEKLFSSKYNLKKHVQGTHGSKGISCKKCKETFESHAEKRQHLEESVRCRQYICNFCGVKFASWFVKQNHISTVHKHVQISHSCPECGESFKERMKLRYHFQEKHDKSNTCHVCEKSFKAKRYLRDHMTVHTKEKEYQCNVCDKFFTRQDALNTHMAIHCEDRKIVCKLCGKKFNQRVTWKSHMKSYHPESLDIDSGNRTLQDNLKVH